MRLRTVVSCVAIGLMAGACGNKTSNVGGPGATVSPDSVSLGLGKHQQFHVALVVSDTSAQWSLPGAVDRGHVSRSGMYYAPLRPPASSPIRVVAKLGVFSAEGTILLTTQPPDPGDCLADGQAANEAPFGSYVYVEELPEAIVKVNPSYPDSAREAGVDGLVLVQAHVCACGEVDSTRVVLSVPMLDAAAVDAVRQWIFKPGLRAGEPVAVWVGIPVKFSLH